MCGVAPGWVRHAYNSSRKHDTSANACRRTACCSRLTTTAFALIHSVTEQDQTKAALTSAGPRKI